MVNDKYEDIKAKNADSDKEFVLRTNDGGNEFKLIYNLPKKKDIMNLNKENTLHYSLKNELGHRTVELNKHR